MTNLPDPAADLTLASRATPTDQAMLQRTGTESIVLDLHSEQYFGLNEVGTRIFELLALDPSLQPTFAALLTEFDVAPEQLQQDLLDLVGKLAHAGLVTLD